MSVQPARARLIRDIDARVTDVVTDADQVTSAAAHSSEVLIGLPF